MSYVALLYEKCKPVYIQLMIMGLQVLLSNCKHAIILGMQIPKQIPTAKVIAAFGNKSKVARAVGITPHAVYQWGEYVPDSRLYHIHYLLTQIALTEQLRNH
tara:strand:- start:229 stop:534 length:306 start_codon:yes stop_codon:yes gene_type:complete